MDDELLKRLLDQYLIGNITEEEKLQLAQLLDHPEGRKRFELIMEEAFRQDVFLKKEDPEIRNRIQNWLKEKLAETEEAGTSIHHSKRYKKVFPIFWKYAAAAFIVIVAGYGVFMSTNRRAQKTLTAHVQKTKANDVSPGKFKAKLTLNDGRVVVLDSANNELLAQQGATNVVNKDGRLVYKQNGSGEQLFYNTLTTSTGETYSMILSDGTKVWLNAKSSIRFPVAFIGRQRKVEVNGEVYFEVAKNKEMPFVVKVNDAEVQVLGTHFNIMAYEEESSVNTTLVEGSVKFIRGESVSILSPGQQSQLTKDGQVKIIKNVDVDNVVAWKNGLFVFDSANLEGVMRQLSRWYGVDIVYKDKGLPQSFVGEVPRNSNLSDVLKVLELTSKNRFEIQGQKIIVN